MAGNGIFDRDLIQAFSVDAVGALAATTGAATASFVAQVANPVTGALAATVAPAAADLDAVETFEGALAAASAASQAALVGVVANPVTGELAGTTAAAQADLDAIEDFPAELAAATAPAQADLDGQVDGPFVGELAAQTGAAVADLDGEVTVTVVGELAAQTAPAVAQLLGIAGEEAPPVGGVSWKGGLPVEDKPRRRLVLGRLHVEFDRMACEGRALVRIRSKSAVARLRGSMAIAQGLVAPKPQVVGFGEIPMSGLHAAGCAEPVYPPDPVMAELLGLEAIAEEIR
jgi:hypothetical protein